MPTVQPKQVSLNYHPENEQQSHPFKNPPVNRPITTGNTFVLRQRKRHRSSRHKQEKRHHKIPETKPFPNLMVELIEDAIKERYIQLPCQHPKHRLEKDKKKQVKTPEDIQRGQPGVIL